MTGETQYKMITVDSKETHLSLLSHWPGVQVSHRARLQVVYNKSILPSYSKGTIHHIVLHKVESCIYELIAAATSVEI